MNCPNCGSVLSPDAAFCPQCGSAVASAPPQAEAYAQPNAPQPEGRADQSTPYSAAQPQSFNGNDYSSNTQYAYQQPVYDPSVNYNANPAEEKSAKTLGIVAIIVGLFIPLVGWICGGTGLSKLKKVPPEYRSPGYSSAKGLCIAGIVVASVMFVLALISQIGSLAYLSF